MAKIIQAYNIIKDRNRNRIGYCTDESCLKKCIINDCEFFISKDKVKQDINDLKLLIELK